MNGDKKDDVRQAGNLSGWYFGAPYGIYSTKDSFIAISLGSLDALSEALEIPPGERVPDAESYERREEAAAGVSRALKNAFDRRVDRDIYPARHLAFGGQ